MMPRMAGRDSSRFGVKDAATGAHGVRTRRSAAARVSLVACAIVALAAMPAGAQLLTQVGVAEPAAGTVVTGSRVVVEVLGLGQAEAAQARVVVGDQARTVDLVGPEAFTGGSRWFGKLDFSGLPNGPARVEGRARFAGASDMTPWSGNDVALDLPAPAISLHVAPVAGVHDAVALTWSAANVPDVSGYELQRALAGGGFETVITAGAGQLAHTDVGIPPGDHRYRVRALRPSGTGGFNAGSWAEGVASLAPPPGIVGADGSLTSQGEPTSGVAARPPSGGISARLRAGTQGMSLPPMDLPPPQVAPRDVGAPGVEGEVGPDGEQLALDGQPLAISHDGPAGMTGDSVRLVTLLLVGLLAIRAHRLNNPARQHPSGPLQVRLSAGPAPGGGEAWRGARDWSRQTKP